MEGHSKLKTLLLIGSFLSSPFFLMIFTLFVVVLFVVGAFDGDGSGSGEKCVSLPTVSTVCKTITVAGEGTMSIDEYIAGVIQAEVGGLQDENLDMYKAGAIAARSYVLANATKDDTGNCTVENGQHFQAYKANPTEEQIKAANDTSGMVLIKDGNIYSSQYDAFCYDSKDSNYYQVCQGNGGFTSIPVSWADSIVPSDYRAAPRTHSHGNGMSQYGAYYLITKEGKNYQDVLNYFYGDDGATLASINSASQICTSTNNGNLKALDSYILENEGLNKLNRVLTEDERKKLADYINDSVNDAGYGTGAGVATAGQSLAHGLSQWGFYLGYYWGGDRNTLGVSDRWGANVGYEYTSGGTATGPEWGMDCSGFVSWTIRNACDMNFGAPVAETFASYGSELTDLNNAKPGDVLANSGHVILIVKNNGDGSVTTVESSVSKGVVFRQVTSIGSYSLRNMEDWYNNNCNKIGPSSNS